MTMVAKEQYSEEELAKWNSENLKRAWLSWIDSVDLTKPVKSKSTGEEMIIPKKRLIAQAEVNPVVRGIFTRWEDLDPKERQRAWEELKQATQDAMSDILPACVQCGECCRKSGPVLHLDDMDLLRYERIPWKALYTIRSGEPVTSPDGSQIFFLVDERIKLREKENSKECIFLDSETNLCTIYDDRPLECRAQACWDNRSYQELENYPYLTRRDLFSHIEVLWDVIEAHKTRCSFEKLYGLIKLIRNETSQEKASAIASEIIDLVGYENHFRSFMADQLKIPTDVLDLVFGRSLEKLLEFFGYRIKTEGDTKFLEIIESQANLTG
ncbi:MAG: YkgJ family cysteine cluster protein [Thermodesulforhabdaceae bacterium]